MKLPIYIADQSKEPIYYQIEHQIKALIVSGHLPPSTLLPSIRSLANDVKCSVITTRRAYQNLENDGYIETIQGKGTYVKQLDQSKIDETRASIIRLAFQNAIEQGKQLGSSDQALRHVFEEVLKSYGE